MKRVLIFGTGSTGRRIYKDLRLKADVIGFLDNNSSKWGEKIEGVQVLGNGEILKDISYDEIVVASLPGMVVIKKQLIDLGIPSHMINTDYISTQVNARINFIRDYSVIHKDVSQKYSNAEGGVFQGDFAKEINACFPNNKLYLFDTFEGFDGRDTEKEHKEGFSIFEQSHLNNTSVDIVMNKMQYPEQVEIRKGYFPDTITGLEDEQFFLVNLDFDLYNPTIEGLRFFYPRLVADGIILIHDYYNEGYIGIKHAIDDFESEQNIKMRRFPIGDHCSIAIIK